MAETNLTAEAILGLQDREVRAVRVPEWGEGAVVHVRSMSGEERDEFDAEQAELGKDGEQGRDRLWRARVLVRVLCDAQGELLFKPVTKQDGRRAWPSAVVTQLAARHVKALDRLVTVAMRLSRLGSAEEAELLGNSGGGLSAASGSGSPETAGAR